ncbi:MAG: hypothetical protein KGV56_04990 [Gammaproteobacteria bacterium]|nr:hypothetical protein [Gammaproteobacteria bacterium]
MSVKQLLILSFSALVIGGCASPLPTTLNSKTSAENTTDVAGIVIKDETVSKQHYGCKYIQRNLTVFWDQRSYWCVPNN